MELKSYIEGNLRRWWLIVGLVAIAFFIGRYVESVLPAQYVASASVLPNGPLLASSIPSSKVDIRFPLYYEAQLTSPATLTIINKHYPRLSMSTLQKSIAVLSDPDTHGVLITVTDSKPESAVDIANYLSHVFVQEETAALQKQVTYYQNLYTQQVQTLTNTINSLNTTIQNLTPAKTRNSAPLTEAQKVAISNDQYQLNLDESNLYEYQRALVDLQNTSALLPNAYVIMQPATTSTTPLLTPLSSTTVELIALAGGLLLALIINTAIDYFTPAVRNKDELKRIAGVDVEADLPSLTQREQHKLLAARSIFKKGKTQSLRLFSARLIALAMRYQALTIVFTGLSKKHSLAAVMAMFLARSGCRTLLIDAHFRDPQELAPAIPGSGPANLTTPSGMFLPGIAVTAYPHLFVLTATARLANGAPVTSIMVMQLLPELKKTFSVIVIDAPPISASDTHLLAAKADKILLLVRKRKDSLHALKAAYVQYHTLKLDPQGLFIA